MNNLDLKGFQDREQAELEEGLRIYFESPEYKRQLELIQEVMKNVITSAYLEGGKVCAKRMLHIMDEVMGKVEKGIPSPFV